MFAGLRSLVQSVTPVTRISPTRWEPSDPLPYGSTAIRTFLSTPLSSHSSISFVADGSWAHGTIVFEVVPGSGMSEAGQGTASQGPPPYSLDTGRAAVVSEKGKAVERMDVGASASELGEVATAEGALEVVVEVRYNDEQLFAESKVTLTKVADAVEILVKVCHR